MHARITELLRNAASVLNTFVSEEANINAINDIAQCLADIFINGGKVIIFGNGGSMCDSMHFAEELTGRFRNDRPALPAIALSDPSFLTCTANDYGYDHVFARGVEAFAKEGDMVIGLSTSGNSKNIINALTAAYKRGCTTVALLGGTGGKLKGQCNYELIVPASTSDRVQEVHIKVLHIIVEMVEEKLFSQ